MDSLQYPQIKANLDLCNAQLAELCQGAHDKAIMSVPPQENDFDMQISAAFDELKAYRNTGFTPEQIPKWIPVSEKLPPKGECLVAYADGSVHFASIIFPKDFKHCAYWMPLPQPPKGGKSC